LNRKGDGDRLRLVVVAVALIPPFVVNGGVFAANEGRGDEWVGVVGRDRLPAQLAVVVDGVRPRVVGAAVPLLLLPGVGWRGGGLLNSIADGGLVPPSPPGLVLPELKPLLPLCRAAASGVVTVIAVAENAAAAAESKLDDVWIDMVAVVVVILILFPTEDRTGDCAAVAVFVGTAAGVRAGGGNDVEGAPSAPSRFSSIIGAAAESCCC
jgi:hypothetical protein